MIQNNNLIQNNSENVKLNVKGLHTLYLLLNAFDIGFLVSDNSGSIIYSNTSLLKLFGINYEEIHSKNIQEFIDYLEKNCLNELGNVNLLKELSKNEEKNVSLILSCKENRFIKFSSYPLKTFGFPYRLWVFVDYTDKIAGGITIKFDVQSEITEVNLEDLIRKLEENNLQLQKQIEELTQDKSSKEKFISVIAHDLKSPFQGLLGIFDIISETFDELTTDELKKYLGYAKTSVKNLYNLIEGLLQWSRFALGTVQFNPTKCNLYQEMVNVINLNKNALENKKLTVINYLKENLEAFADETMVNAIFNNLLSNAIKYSKRGGTIVIDAERHENYIQVSIADQGVGMDKDIQEKLFKLGEQITTHGTENETGTGLGLILCKEMVELNSGKIWFESEPGKGSTFYITLPKAK
ncbi:MAG: PAS domain-containing sensor histidine kinase [Melioribacter sp.]|uniref:sensor histidine kinase n=1 Tax=Rosettibacter primus TaxID=3111523 RepID=UPI00247CFA64|nr:PAS domain-containing sensor histidine kinase [Melioribacter sp.]